MRLKSVMELISLSANLYLVAQDKEIMDELSKLANKGKDRFKQFVDGMQVEDNDEMKLLQKVFSKAKIVQEELEERIEEIVVQVYKKLHIATTDEIAELKAKIQLLESRLNTEITNANLPDQQIV